MYDIIIVGAGSAGCVLAYRLSENPRHRVLLIEAGPPDNSPFVHMPSGLARTLADPRRVWNYATEPADHPAARSQTWQRGKMLGGSSTVNGMIYLRGQPADYDQWAADGAVGWDWSAMSGAFRQMEGHGADGGPLKITVQPPSPLGRALIAAGTEMGLPVSTDLNSAEGEAIGPTPCTISDGRRSSAGQAFIRPARGRRNLTVLTNTRVLRILMEGRRATGVECEGGARYPARDIVLSAGAFHSPALLLQAGIGPAEELKALGVRPIHDLPGVGKNLREHKTFTIQLRLKRKLGFNHEVTGPRLLANVLRYGLSRSGPMARTHLEVNALLRSSPQETRPDLQIGFNAVGNVIGAPSLQIHPFPTVGAFAYPMRPNSQGVLSLRSPDPYAPPRIQPNFLADEDDRRRTVAMVRLLRTLFSQPALADIVDREIYPGAEHASDEEIIAACHSYGSAFHAVGTCRIGADPLAVVDARLRVRGVEGLRIMDCSVLPSQVSGNTNGPVMGMAWRAADLIMEDLRVS